jgi:hypothetical protein
MSKYCSVDPLLGNELKINNETAFATNQENIFLISKCTQPLLGNAFANKHVPAETFGIKQMNGIFYAVRAEML